MKLLITGFIQVFFISINTFFISKQIFAGVFIVGCIISFIWSWNVKKIAFGTIADRLYYSLGAGLGSLFGLFCSVWVYKLIS